MNDIIEPTKPGAEGSSPAKPGEPLNLRTPEQDAADAQAKKDREARLQAQARSQQISRVDGMAYGTGARKPDKIATVSVPNPSVQPGSTESVFVLPKDQVEQKQPETEPAESQTDLEMQPSNDGAVAPQLTKSEKPPGFFKRLLGGGKKKSEQQIAQPPTTEQQQ